MIRVPITSDEMLVALVDVNTVLPKYALDDPTEAARIVRLFREALTPYDGEAVRGAAKLGLKTWERFPSPAAWRTVIHEWIRHNRTTIQRDELTQRDSDGNAVICKTCRSVARSTWLRRLDGSEYSRLIAPCDLSRHQPDDRVTHSPENFLAWDDRTPDQHWADYHAARVTA